MRISKHTHLLILFTFTLFIGKAQSFLPIVTQYSKKDYKAGNQNWSVSQDADRVMYFGNNEGVMSFDGWNFDLVRLPGNQVVRAVYAGSKNKVYAGGFGEFGYFEKNELGKSIYTSLSSQLKKYSMQNDEIWHITEFDGRVIFQSFASIFVWDGKNVRAARYPFTFMYLYPFQHQLFIYSHKNGFCKFDINSMRFSSYPNEPFKSPVISVLSVNEQKAFIITESEGIFTFDGVNFSKFQTDAEEELTKWGVNKAVLSRDSLLIIGTIQNGVVAFNSQGKKMWELNTSNVLQNNTVLGMYCDVENNIWLALDKGISMINLSNPLRLIHSFFPSIGSVYSLAYHQSALYLATNQGLYQAKFSAEDRRITDIKLDPQIRGQQVWNLFQADGQLFCGNNQKTYELSNASSVRIASSVDGGMCMAKGSIGGKDVLVQGTYNEICVYTKQNGKWAFSHTINNFNNPIKTIQVDFLGNIWAAHFHKGMYRITLKEDLRTIDKMIYYKSLDGKNQFPIRVYSLNNRAVFSDNNAFYIFDDLKNKIIPFNELNSALGKFSQANNVCYHKQGMYWLIRNDEAGLFKIKERDFSMVDRLHFFNLQSQTIDNNESILPLDNNVSLIALENALGWYETDKKTFQPDLPRFRLVKIEAFDKKTGKKQLLPPAGKEKNKLTHTQSSVVFSVCFPHYTDLNNIFFRYRLVGLDDKWESSSGVNIKRYDYLHPGNYTFIAEVTDNKGNVLDKTEYAFTVKPPFYWSSLFKLLYLLLFVLLLYFIYRKIQQKYADKKAKYYQEQEELRKKEIEKREQQILSLEKDKLATELSLKSKELAASTMTIIKKNELLTNIKEEIVTLKKTLGTQYPNKYYDKLVKLLDENISSEDDWQVFQTNFDRIHENFFRNLHTKYPELTANDLRFCAYLRLNLSTKDIAHLMNISPKGVEVARYRIRKKIGIPSEKSLTEFLIEFK